MVFALRERKKRCTRRGWDIGLTGVNFLSLEEVISEDEKILYADRYEHYSLHARR